LEASLSRLPFLSASQIEGRRSFGSMTGEPFLAWRHSLNRAMQTQTGAVLHVLFTLADGVTEQEFLPAYATCYGHLKDMGRQPLDGFGDDLPDFSYHVAIEFPDLERDQACYDYVKKNDEPVRSLHRAMNSKVRRGSSNFFLGVYI
jgi:hypothetical protein